MRVARVRGKGSTLSFSSSVCWNPLNLATRRHVSFHVAGAGVSEASEGSPNGTSMGVCVSESDVRLTSRNGRVVNFL